VAEEAAENLRKSFPALRVAGTADGYSGRTGRDRKDHQAAPGCSLSPRAPGRKNGWPKTGKLCTHVMMGLGGSQDVLAGRVGGGPRPGGGSARVAYACFRAAAHFQMLPAAEVSALGRREGCPERKGERKMSGLRVELEPYPDLEPAGPPAPPSSAIVRGSAS
jgi:hypothetical protein